MLNILKTVPHSATVTANGCTVVIWLPVMLYWSILNDLEPLLCLWHDVCISNRLMIALFMTCRC